MGISYFPTKPAAGDRPANDQAPMQTNFANIQTLIDVDHVDFANANYGMHQWVQLPSNYAAGATVSIPRLFINNVDGNSNTLPGSLSQLFFYNSGLDTQSSKQYLINTAASGSVMLFAGIILKWGSDTFSGSQNPSITFSTAFPNTCFNVQLTVLNTNATVPAAWRLSTISASGWTGNVQASGTTTLYWIAIGN